MHTVPCIKRLTITVASLKKRLIIAAVIVKKKDRKLIATREAVGCQSLVALANCTEFLDTMRQSARFSLKVVTIEGPMPHNKELQVQAGGCLQFRKILFPCAPEAPEIADTTQRAPFTGNIFAIVTAAVKKYGSH